MVNWDKWEEELLAEKKRIDMMLKFLKTRMGRTPVAKRFQGKQPVMTPVQPKRKLSQAAKNKIAAAQRARWAEVKKKKQQTKQGNHKAKAA